MRRSAAAAAVAATMLLAAACSAAGGAEDDVVELEFFQFKPEAFATFNGLVEQFNATHPDIRVRQNQVPDAETAIRTRLVREDLPDVMTLNGNATYGEIASAGVLYDFSGEESLTEVRPAILEILQDLGRYEEQTNGIPLASNANAFVYNKEIFAEHGLEPPQTWSEFRTVVEELAAAGVQPYALTLVDAWTTMPYFNQLAANLVPEDFFDRLAEDEASFQEAYPPVADALLTLTENGNDDAAGLGYDDGNRLFANGESAILMHGSYVIPAVRALNPDLDLGSFALPATDDPAETKLVSGVDVILTMGANPRHEEESLEFIRFLMEPENIQRYVDEQSAVPTLEGLEPSDPTVAEVFPFFEQERVTSYVEHSIPPAVNLQPLTQAFLLSGNSDRWLRELDEEWDKVAARSSFGTEP
ncbi:extracellular solute-binding protein [Georgenia sp. TF02-10]|uniref:ABC transporter substrate-binding protein n=1 Tax=Georgenia sp. TF02-10 TaxID=2917725 RepID=UPI001FA6BC08|nr:extracellular solute-binding protein [Georgenia sp. TF02-10]UNX54819.1 extracellular solute-binding protein [Georgenia sp. TF02-10]